MRQLRIGIIDLLTKGPERSMFARVMAPNFASIMPQVIGVWCEQAGHDVTFLCYTGFEDLEQDLPKDLDLIFIASFSVTAQLAYALSNWYQSNGVCTVLGGPHARCYPQDAQKYFDYVLGFTDRSIIDDVLRDCSPHRPLGVRLQSNKQPEELPGVVERWKFIEPMLAKAPIVKLVPMIGSLGCPYTCSFCIDSEIPYQPLDFAVLKRDLRFIQTKMKRPLVGWHDPNFGVRFNDYLDAIEEAVPNGSIDFIAESSLSLLSEPHVARMQKAGFKAILPGVESWYDMGGKSKTGSNQGIEKVRQVADHVNMILRHIPYVQTNFVLGLDCDEGPEPFELTKKFVDLCPGAFPAYSLLTAFGQAAPLNLQYQRDGRVLPHPFFLLNSHSAMNVIPKHYSWKAFYDNLIDMTRYSFSWRAVGRRFQANRGLLPTGFNMLRALSNEGTGRVDYYAGLRARLDTDVELQRYMDGETTALPGVFANALRRSMGPFYQHLPAGAIDHDQNAYLKSTQATATLPVTKLRPSTAEADMATAV
jgi:hypothetical protein